VGFNLAKNLWPRILAVGIFLGAALAGSSALAATFTSIAIGTQSGTATYGTAASLTYTVTVTATGNGNNNVSCAFNTITGLPTGVSAVFNPDPATGKGAGDSISTLTLTTIATTPAVTNQAFTVSCTPSSGGSLSVNGSLTINPRPLTITPSSGQSKVYGNADPAFTYSITSGSLVPGDTLSGALSRNSGENVGAYAFTLGTLSNANYSLSLAAGAPTFSITARPVTVTADPKTKNAGALDPALTYSITSGSLVSGDSPTGALARVAGESPGTYQITQGTLSLGSNYALSYVPANLTIVSVTSRFNAFETVFFYDSLSC